MHLGDVEGYLPGSNLGMQALVVCWMELRRATEGVMIEEQRGGVFIRLQDK